jgi:hypothetical protein
MTQQKIQLTDTDKTKYCMKVFEVLEAREGHGPTQGWKAYCTNTPQSKMSNSWLSSCKARGYVARDTGKSQKIGDKRKSLDGIKAKSEKYGGPISRTRTG